MTDTHPWNAEGNAERIYERYEWDLRWVRDQDCWAQWMGDRWALAPDAGARAAKATFARLADEEAGQYDAERKGDKPSQRDLFRKWLLTLGNPTAKHAAASELAMSGKVDAVMSDFDANPAELGVRNGVLRLDDAILRDHDPGDLITKRAEARIVYGARAPRWEAFLAQMQPDLVQREWLQKAMGYTATGSTSEQIAVLHRGTTANGKSLFLDVIATVLGDYAVILPQGSLTSREDRERMSTIASLRGARMAFLDETSEGDIFNEGLIKTLTSGGAVTGRAPYGKPITYATTAKLHIATNFPPHVTTDPALRRRLRVVNWPVSLSADQIDRGLKAYLLERERDGILAWLMIGAERWYAEGLGEPLSVAIEVENLIRDNDQVGRWLDESVTIGDTHVTLSTPLYQAYRWWCEAQGERPASQKVWGPRVVAKGVEKRRTNAGWVYGATTNVHAPTSP